MVSLGLMMVIPVLGLGLCYFRFRSGWSTTMPTTTMTDIHCLSYLDAQDLGGGGNRGCWGGHGERGARAYYGCLEAEPPVGSRGRAPGQEVRGQRPPEAESFLLFVRLGRPQIHVFFGIWAMTRVREMLCTLPQKLAQLSTLSRQLR